MRTSATAKSIGINYLALTAIAGLLTALLWPMRDVVQSLNFALAYQGVVTYTTGALIALFLALFYSNGRKVEYLRNHRQARTLATIIVFDMLIAVSSGLLIGVQVKDPGDLGLVGEVVMAVATVDLTKWIVKLINLALAN